VRRAGATGQLTVGADSGFWSVKVIRRLRRGKIRYSITVRLTRPVRQAIAAIPDDAWIDICYPDSGVAQVAEARFRGDRLIVRRTRHHTGPQGELFPAWQYHALVTDRPGTAIELDADHRHHAVVELAIRDLKAGAGLAHLPSGKFNANAAWLVLATLAHNLIRWVAALGLAAAGTVVAKTVRRTLLALPGRLTRSHAGGRCTCPPAGRGRSASPTRWPGCAASRTRPDRSPPAYHLTSRPGSRQHARPTPGPPPTPPPHHPKAAPTQPHHQTGPSRPGRSACRWCGPGPPRRA